MGTVKASVGRVSVAITGDAAALDPRAIAVAIAPRTVHRFEREARGIFREARKTWPIGFKRRTGQHSRDLFRAVTRTLPDAIETTLTNTARAADGRAYPYVVRWSRFTRAEIARQSKTPAQARYMHRQHGLGAPSAALIEKRPWQVLIVAPHRKSIDRVARDLEAELGRLADGGR